MRFKCLALLFLLGLSVQPAVAGHGIHCPRCRQWCDVTVEESSESKHCWKVQSQTICIPRVTLPWEVCKSSCDDCPQPARCARVKHVNVLVKHEYECPSCKYSFSPCPTGCGCAEEHPPAPAATAAAPFAPTVNVELERAAPAPIPVSASEPKQQAEARSYFEVLTGFFK